MSELCRLTNCFEYRCEFGTLCKVHWLGQRSSRIAERCKHSAYYKDIKYLLTRKQFIHWGLVNWPEGMKEPTVDRISPKGHYEIENMRWLPNAQNMRKNNMDLPDDMARCPACQVVKDRATAFYSGSGKCKTCKRQHDQIKGATRSGKHVPFNSNQRTMF